LSYFSKNPEGLAKVRKEFAAVGKEMITEDASIANLNKKDLMRKVVTLETIQDLSFLNLAMQETLRFQNPAAANTPVYFTKEGGTLGKYKVDTTTEIAVVFHALHKNAKQW